MDLLKRLVRTADVLVENFRPGVMDRLGIGPQVLRAENPALIYCAISGFGQDGPWRDRPAYDQIVQGAAGVMAVTGSDDSGPMRVGYPISDTVGGLTAAMAICAALNAPERGAVIDVSMLEATLGDNGLGGVEPSDSGSFPGKERQRKPDLGAVRRVSGGGWVDQYRRQQGRTVAGAGTTSGADGSAGNAGVRNARGSKTEPPAVAGGAGDGSDDPARRGLGD